MHGRHEASRRVTAELVDLYKRRGCRLQRDAWRDLWRAMWCRFARSDDR
ncbi:hypothetical protein [Bradyrhizobium sp. Cp5.3]|nr:hypothetical protein [Bradyrhizobium sp. Cp5.3]